LTIAREKNWAKFVFSGQECSFQIYYDTASSDMKVAGRMAYQMEAALSSGRMVGSVNNDKVFEL
jgi:hypothetical protein